MERGSHAKVQRTQLLFPQQRNMTILKSTSQKISKNYGKNESGYEKEKLQRIPKKY